MLNIVRRGPASIAKSSIASLKFPKFPNLDTSRTLLHPTARRCSVHNLRALHTSLQWRQESSLGATSTEDKTFEGHASQDTKSPDTKLSSQIKRTTSHGPLTKFAELAERNLVCDTIVNTIVKSLGLETMTEVQSLTINEILKGPDV